MAPHPKHRARLAPWSDYLMDEGAGKSGVLYDAHGMWFFYDKQAADKT